MSTDNVIEKQIKFAVVIYGGGSLAIYINGVAQELLRLTQATVDGAVDGTKKPGHFQVSRENNAARAENFPV